MRQKPEQPSRKVHHAHVMRSRHKFHHAHVMRSRHVAAKGLEKKEAEKGAKPAGLWSSMPGMSGSRGRGLSRAGDPSCRSLLVKLLSIRPRKSAGNLNRENRHSTGF